MMAIDEEVQVKRAAVEDGELEEIQKLALTGYDFRNVLHLVLRVRSGGEARAFLAELLRSDLLTFSDRPRGRDYAVNVGLTFRGLAKFGLPERHAQELARKAPSFTRGAAVRAAALGDAGESAAERWQRPFHVDNADVLISVHGRDGAVVRRVAQELPYLKPARAAFDGWDGDRMEGEHLTNDPLNRRVFFGFRDSVTRPVPECSLLKRGKPRHSAGELLLGYGNDAELNHWGAGGTSEEVARFFRNGAFAILRKMQQHEDRFERFLRSRAEALLESPVEGLPADQGGLETYLKAKLCGRWPNGARLKPGQTTEPPEPTWEELLADSEFDFVSDDRHAHGCPFGAHIRRASPRGDPVLPGRRRPLFRRGVPYLDRRAKEGGSVEEERGLLGLFFCASIEDQFEHVLSEWVEKMPMGPPSRGDAKDPILGQHDGSPTVFHIPGGGPGIRLEGFDAPFVTTRGTLYALFPSRRALQDLTGFVDP